MSVLRGVVLAIPGHCRSGLSGSEPRPAHIPHSHILHEVLPRPEASRASFEIVTGLNVVQLLQMEREPAPAEGPTQPHSQRCSGVASAPQRVGWNSPRTAKPQKQTTPAAS